MESPTFVNDNGGPEVVLRTLGARLFPRFTQPIAESDSGTVLSLAWCLGTPKPTSFLQLIGFLVLVCITPRRPQTRTGLNRQNFWERSECERKFPIFNKNLFTKGTSY